VVKALCDYDFVEGAKCLIEGLALCIDLVLEGGSSA
jgi:hypothetical protein